LSPWREIVSEPKVRLVDSHCHIEFASVREASGVESVAATPSMQVTPK